MSVHAFLLASYVQNVMFEKPMFELLVEVETLRRRTRRCIANVMSLSDEREREAEPLGFPYILAAANVLLKLFFSFLVVLDARRCRHITVLRAATSSLSSLSIVSHCFAASQDDCQARCEPLDANVHVCLAKRLSRCMHV